MPNFKIDASDNGGYKPWDDLKPEPIHSLRNNIVYYITVL